MAHDSRKTVIEFLSAPLASSSSTLVFAGDDTRQKGTRRTSGGLGALASTIHFLKEREIEHFYACIVSFEDVKGQAWEMVCFVQQDAQGNWVLRNGSGGAPRHAQSALENTMTTTPTTPMTRAELISGPGIEGGFFAGGYLIGPDAHSISRVSLLDADGAMLEDTVSAEDNGRVLFVTEHHMRMPVRVERV